MTMGLFIHAKFHPLPWHRMGTGVTKVLNSVVENCSFQQFLPAETKTCTNQDEICHVSINHESTPAYQIWPDWRWQWAEEPANLKSSQNSSWVVWRFFGRHWQSSWNLDWNTTGFNSFLPLLYSHIFPISVLFHSFPLSFHLLLPFCSHFPFLGGYGRAASSAAAWWYSVVIV